MKIVLDGNSFLGGDRRNSMRGIRQMCENVMGTTFATPDGRWLIHVDYETVSEENHRRDEFNINHIDHYFRATDKIKSVSVESL
jgi:hypothetical protein